MRRLAALAGFVVTAIVTVGLRGPMTAQAPAEQAPVLKVCVLKVDGMTCGGCEAAVRSAARKVEGVKDAKVSYAKGTAEVTYDPAKTSPEAIARAITDKSGFKAEAPKQKP
jgi:mercuric ion binding protein